MIAFEKVDFSYHENVPVLQGLTFSVKKGENVAFVGESGGGKSTIFRILCGFYEKTGGEYRIFGRPIEEWNREALREQIALVSQNVFLFPTTIAENIAYSKPGATKEQIVEACKKAQIHDFIQTLPEGYETMVGERGAILSGGQKQRLAIAQTILNSPEILIFDEPSAGLDPFEREQFKRIMVKLKETSIIIISTHIVSDIDTITDDLIILNKGSVIANDSPDVLFEHIRGMVWDIPKADIGLLPIENIYYEDTKSKTISKTKPTPNAVISEPTMNDLYFCGQIDGGLFG